MNVRYLGCRASSSQQAAIPDEPGVCGKFAKSCCWSATSRKSLFRRSYP